MHVEHGMLFLDEPIPRFALIIRRDENGTSRCCVEDFQVGSFFCMGRTPLNQALNKLEHHFLDTVWT